MILRWIFHIIPVPIFFTNKLVPDGFNGISLGLVIFLRPNQKTNESLIQHELTHSRQCWRSFWTLPFRYFLSHDYRFNVEAEAFGVQYDFDRRKDALNHYTTWLVDNYNLDVNVDTAREAIVKYSQQ